MIPGKVLFYGETVFTDWFPRGGDNIIIRAQVIDRDGSVGLDVELWSKNSETPGNGHAVETPGTSTTVKLAIDTSSVAVNSLIFQSAATGTGDYDGLLELVRYKLVVTGGSSGNSLSARLFPPIFFDKGKP